MSLVFNNLWHNAIVVGAEPFHSLHTIPQTFTARLRICLILKILYASWAHSNMCEKLGKYGTNISKLDQEPREFSLRPKSHSSDLSHLVLDRL